MATARQVHAVVSDTHAALLVQFHEPVPAGGLNQVRDLRVREVLGTAEQPGSLVVDDEDCAVVHRVTAGHSAANKMGHDVAATRLGPVASLIRQFCQGVTGDPAGRKGKEGLFLQREWLRGLGAPVGERSSVQAHALAEAAGAPLK